MKSEPQVSCENCQSKTTRGMHCMRYAWDIKDPIIAAETCDFYNPINIDESEEIKEDEL